MVADRSLRAAADADPAPERDADVAPIEPHDFARHASLYLLFEKPTPEPSPADVVEAAVAAAAHPGTVIGATDAGMPPARSDTVTPRRWPWRSVIALVVVLAVEVMAVWWWLG